MKTYEVEFVISTKITIPDNTTIQEVVDSIDVYFEHEEFLVEVDVEFVDPDINEEPLVDEDEIQN